MTEQLFSARALLELGSLHQNFQAANDLGDVTEADRNGRRYREKADDLGLSVLHAESLVKWIKHNGALLRLRWNDLIQGRDISDSVGIAFDSNNDVVVDHG